MKKDTLRLRLAEVAVLFGPPAPVTRKQASEMHSRICDALSLDDIVFAYQSSEKTNDKAPFRAQFRRKAGNDVLQVLLEGQGARKPMRLVVAQSWPAEWPDVLARCDRIAEAIFVAFPGNAHRVVVETRIRAQATADGEDSSTYLRERLVRTPDWFDETVPPVDACSLRYRWNDRDPDGSQAARELQVEPLAGESDQIYLELVSRWMIRTGKESQLGETPSHYLRESLRFLRGTGGSAEQSDRSSRSGKSRLKKKRRTQPNVN